MENLIGLIPAAGKGLRLGLPYPKELYPVIRDNHYKPVSQFVLDNMVQLGLKHIVFVVNETKHQLMGYFGNGHRFGTNISYVVQESPRDDKDSSSPGLAHALDSAYHLTKEKMVFFGMADTIIKPVDIFRIGYEALTPEDQVILLLFSTSQPQKFGMVRADNYGRVLEIVDKPAQTDLTHMWGCMIWRPVFTEYIHDLIQQDIRDFAHILNHAVQDGLCIRGIHVHNGIYIDLGTYQEIMEMDEKFREK